MKPRAILKVKGNKLNFLVLSKLEHFCHKLTRT